MELTPVEWLQVQIKNCPSSENLMNNIDGFLKEAKLMEEKEAKSKGHSAFVCSCGSTKYYTETYKDVTKYYCSNCHQKLPIMR